jgi:Aminoglycoside 3-N-acetyltransferase
MSIRVSGAACWWSATKTEPDSYLERAATTLTSWAAHVEYWADEADTTIHFAEAMAGVRYRRPKYVMVLRDGKPTRYDYSEIDHCCQKFNLMDQWLEAEGRQRRGIVGHAETRLTRSRDVVEVALTRLREKESVFLHPAGVDIECDEARASLAGSPAI